MTTFKQTCLHRHEVAAKLAKLQECKSTMAEYHLKTSGVDALIESKERELESLILDISDRKERLKRFQKVTFEMMVKFTPKQSGVNSVIEHGQRDVEARRKKFTDAGMSSEDAAKFVPDFDAAAQLAKVEECRAIGDAWRKFSESGLESDLPNNAHELLEEIGDYSNQPKFEGTNDQLHKLKYGVV